MFKFNLVNVDAQVYSTDATAVLVPVEGGECCIQAKHPPKVSRLEAGDIKIETSNGDLHHFRIAGGVMEVTPYIVTVLSH